MVPCAAFPLREVLSVQHSGLTSLLLDDPLLVTVALARKVIGAASPRLSPCDVCPANKGVLNPADYPNTHCKASQNSRGGLFFILQNTQLMAQITAVIGSP